MNAFPTPSFDGRPDTVASHVAQRADVALMHALVDEIDCGVILCDTAGSIVFTNRAARQDTRQCGTGHDAAIALQCDGREASALLAAIRQATTRGKRQLLSLSSAGRRLLVSVTPLATAAGAEPRALLMLGRRGTCSPLGLELLGTAHGLTLAERRVLAGLLSDAMPREIAGALGIKVSTVRTQISSIRTKLGARSIEALLLRAAEVPPMASVVRSGAVTEWQGRRAAAAALAA